MTEIRCWRCERKLYELYATVTIPEGIAIAIKCPLCKAMNRNPLDMLVMRHVAFA